MLCRPSFAVLRYLCCMLNKCWCVLSAGALDTGIIASHVSKYNREAQISKIENRKRPRRTLLHFFLGGGLMFCVGDGDTCTVAGKRSSVLKKGDSLVRCTRL